MPSKSGTSWTEGSGDDVHRSLLTAIRAGLVPEVQRLLTEEWTKGDYRNGSLFGAALKTGHPAMVRCLLGSGIVPVDESPLFAAIGEVKVLEAVLAEGFSLHVTSRRLKTLLQTAVSVNPSALPILLRAGCDVTARDGVKGNTALHAACTHSEEASIVRLIRAGAWLNVLNDFGETPLHCLLQLACKGPCRHDFHAKSRHSLARRLLHLGMTVSVTSAGHRSKALTSSGSRQTETSLQGGRGGINVVLVVDYKLGQLYEQLRRETVQRAVWSLQHVCRVRVRQLCEDRVRGEEEAERTACRVQTTEGSGGRRGEMGGGEDEEQSVGMRRRRGTQSARDVIQQLELSPFLKDYLLFREQSLDRTVFTAHHPHPHHDHPKFPSRPL